MAERSSRQIHDAFYCIYESVSELLLIRFYCHCSLNTEQHSAKSAMAKALSGHSGPKSGMAPPMFASSAYHSKGKRNQNGINNLRRTMSSAVF